MNRQILSGATMVLPGRTAEGSVVLEDGRIAEIREGQSYAEGVDLSGQWLIPGLIDMHTDYLEREVSPRPSATFPLEMAFHMMDVRAISCGITTVLGAARISEENDGKIVGWSANGLALARRSEDLRRTALARHFIHIRWNPNFEPVDDILPEVLKLSSIGNLVYNDNIPGERQYRNIFEEQIQNYAARTGVSIAQARAHFEERRQHAMSFNNRSKVQAAAAGRIPLGSHDDTTIEHVLEAHYYGATLAEMPCTIEAARKAKELGMMVCMGAPNYYRGGSHCGNLGCPEALAAGVVDMLCSDFHFPTMLGSAVKMIANGVPASQAINLMSLNPARYLGMGSDLGSIEEGKKADLVAFEMQRDFAVVTNVWVDGAVRWQMNHPSVSRAMGALAAANPNTAPAAPQMHDC